MRWTFILAVLAANILVRDCEPGLHCCSRGTLPNFYTRVARNLSRSSYTLYLVHLPLLVFIAAFLEKDFHRSRWIPDAPHGLMGLGLFLLVMVYAQVVWFCFERRTN